MTLVPRLIRADAEPALANELQPHQLAAAADPHIPIRALTGQGGARSPDRRARS